MPDLPAFCRIGDVAKVLGVETHVVRWWEKEFKRIVTHLDCLVGGSTQPVGTMWFVPSSEGCVTQFDPSVPPGVAVVTCDLQVIDTVPEWQRGSVCVGSQGRNVCDRPTPVSEGTWGAIKAQYLQSHR